MPVPVPVTLQYSLVLSSRRRPGAHSADAHTRCHGLGELETAPTQLLKRKRFVSLPPPASGKVCACWKQPGGKFPWLMGYEFQGNPPAMAAASHSAADWTVVSP